MSAGRRILRFFFACMVLTLAAGLAWAGNRLWPQELGVRPYPPYPLPILLGGRLVFQLPGAAVAGEVAKFDDEVEAYLRFEYLRSRAGVDPASVLLTATETDAGPSYRIFVLPGNDMVTAVSALNELRRRELIAAYELYFWSHGELANSRLQSGVFVAAYNAPAPRKLESLSSSQILAPLAQYVRFKSQTDVRVRAGLDPAPQPLTHDDAYQMAADIIAVAGFYSLPLDAFLGIGAMENNYMDVRGDLEHAVWKRRPEKGDIVVKRRGRRFLVRNYSLGVWQITRETLRYAHKLYLKDERDYGALPARLRPPQTLDIDAVDSEVLTTYAGLLFRDLLDHFEGDVEKAVGAYNGGVRRPNPDYATGVKRVADHARKILEHGAAPSGDASETASRATPRRKVLPGNMGTTN